MKYLQEQLRNKKDKIVWLVSYPKSGNTWFRCFISALFEGEIDLTKLKTDGIFSGRNTFDSITGIDSRLLLDDEVHHMIADVFAQTALYAQRLQFIKVHDAYIRNSSNGAVFPKKETHKVIYIVRNPLDIVSSFAHHNASTKDTAIAMMNNKNGYLAGPKEGLNINIQFRQLMMDWSSHVKSWTKQKELDVILIRYEDMLANPFKVFKNVIAELEIEASDTAIKKAIAMTSFNKLKKQEKEKGFKEKNINAENFFRSGKSNQYLKELTEEQIEKITKAHKHQMKALGYL